MSNFPDFAEYGYQVIHELGLNRAGGRVTYLAGRIGRRQVSGGGSPPALESNQNPETGNVEPETCNDDSPMQVVIKQFQFATTDASWADYDSYDREIQILRGLDHPCIPRYLDCFETPAGFCLVQEYKEAESLAVPRKWTLVQIKQIAIALLEILVYLQNRIPPVIHRDIKPENILVDYLEANSKGASLVNNVYLVDFGFAHIGEGEVAASSVVKGTLGFMPPEQLFNRQLTPASDLYGIGATLICLLTGTESIDIGNLIDTNYRMNFQPLANKLSQEWIKWLAKMVEPKPKDRFADAAAALEALKPIEVSRVPKVISSHQIVQFTANKLGETLTQTIRIKNPVRGTLLTGRWRVAPHPSDPRTKTAGHSWISFSPQRFKSNETECQVTVNPSRLRAGETYERELLLHTNSASEPYTLALKVQTAPLPVATMKLPYGWLAIVFGLAVATASTGPVNLVTFLLNFTTHSNVGNVAFCVLLLWGLVASVQLMLANRKSARKGAIAGGLIGAILGAIAVIGYKFGFLIWLSCFLGTIVGAYASAGTVCLTQRQTDSAPSKEAKIVAVAVAAVVTGAWPLWVTSGLITSSMAFCARVAIVILAGIGAGRVVDVVKNRGFSLTFSLGISLLTATFGISLGMAFHIGVGNPFVLLSLIGSGIVLGKMIYPAWQRSQYMANYYRRSQGFLIKP